MFNKMRCGTHTGRTALIEQFYQKPKQNGELLMVSYHNGNSETRTYLNK